MRVDVPSVGRRMDVCTVFNFYGLVGRLHKPPKFVLHVGFPTHGHYQANSWSDRWGQPFPSVAADVAGTTSYGMQGRAPGSSISGVLLPRQIQSHPPVPNTQV